MTPTKTEKKKRNKMSNWNKSTQHLPLPNSRVILFNPETNRIATGHVDTYDDTKASWMVDCKATPYNISMYPYWCVFPKAEWDR
jgi:hypothetical protein